MNRIFLGLFFAQLAIISIGQVPTTDFELKSGSPVLVDPNDQHQYPADLFKEYFIEFDKSDLAQVDRVWVELAIEVEGQKSIILRKSYSTKELNDKGYKTANHIRISFGNLEIADYELSMQLERAGKKLEKKTTKTVNQ